MPGSALDESWEWMTATNATPPTNLFWIFSLGEEIIPHLLRRTKLNCESEGLGCFFDPRVHVGVRFEVRRVLR